MDCSPTAGSLGSPDPSEQARKVRAVMEPDLKNGDDSRLAYDIAVVQATNTDF